MDLSGLEVAREEDTSIGSASREDVMRTKIGSMPVEIALEGSLTARLYQGIVFPRQACHCENWLGTTDYMRRFNMKMKLPLGLAMNMPIVSKAAPVT